jgi:hypothetical protein
VFPALDALTAALVEHVRQKGQVPPGRYRAYGHRPPAKLAREAKLAWRDLRLRFGKPPEGSSPAKQQARGLNRDATLRPKRGEGKKVRG